MNFRVWASVVLLFLFLFSFHALDVGMVLVRNNQDAANGFWVFDASQLYHIGMYGEILSFGALFVLYIYAVREEKRNEEKVAGSVSNGGK